MPSPDLVVSDRLCFPSVFSRDDHGRCHFSEYLPCCMQLVPQLGCRGRGDLPFPRREAAAQPGDLPGDDAARGRQPRPDAESARTRRCSRSAATPGVRGAMGASARAGAFGDRLPLTWAFLPPQGRREEVFLRVSCVARGGRFREAFGGAADGSCRTLVVFSRPLSQTPALRLAAVCGSPCGRPWGAPGGSSAPRPQRLRAGGAGALSPREAASTRTVASPDGVPLSSHHQTAR